MGFTIAELDDFHRFAHTRLRKGTTNVTLEECLRQWRLIDEDREAAIADIQQGIADEKAGRVRPLADVLEDIRNEFGFSS